MTWGIVGLDGKPTQLVSTVEKPLPCVRCKALLEPGRRALCQECVEKVSRQRHGKGKRAPTVPTEDMEGMSSTPI